MSASYILVDCPHCVGTGEEDAGETCSASAHPFPRPCSYCCGGGQLEQDIDREAQAGDERLKVEEEDKP